MLYLPKEITEITGLWTILSTWAYTTSSKHLDNPKTYARILFVDFSSALNNIIPEPLQDKLSQLNVSGSIGQRIIDFLTKRTQHVKLRKHLYPSLATRTRVLTSTPITVPVKLLNFAYYTTGRSQHRRRWVHVPWRDDRLVAWCSHNNLELYTDKTVEMVNFRKHPPPSPLRDEWLNC